MDDFEAIADPVRRALIERLARGPARVVDLAADHPISRPAISRHLRVLGESGVTTAIDHGRERHYELAPGALASVRAWLDAVGSEVVGTDAVDSEVVEPRFDSRHLDALDLEVRRTVRERGQPDAHTESLDSTPAQTDSIRRRHKETG
ncbi:ArsR/SmtB family transcription factor [Gordonia sp. NPDC058843]|uniref:ArsR/SmtB family transcription factor n=1 Tax=Gordonia sp. NPDC058843 TaxID=3346648 RepID=UPI00369A02C6